MTRFLLHWLAVTVALGVAAWLLPGVTITSWVALFVGGLVLGLINAVVRPVMVVLTLPITLLTLGLFLFVVNAAAFALAAAITPGFSVSGLGSAILGALLTSLLSWLIDGGRNPPPARERSPQAS